MTTKKYLRAAILVVALAACTAALSACGIQNILPHTITTKEALGTWVYSDSRGHRSTLSIEKSGHFTIDMVPRQVFTSGKPDTDRLDWHHPISYTGTWSIDAKLDEVVIVFSTPESYARAGNVLQAIGFPTTSSLEASLGNPDDNKWFVYHRSQ